MLWFFSPHIPCHKIIVLSDVGIFFIVAIIFVYRKQFHAQVFLWMSEKVPAAPGIHR